MFDHDLHVHTYLSHCCPDKENNRPDRILAAAERLGRRTIGFADHIWVNRDVPPSSWYRPQDETQTARLREDLASIETPVRVLIGCEADTPVPGQFTITPQYAETLDYVGLSCSHFHMRNFVQQPTDQTPRGLATHMLAFFVSGVRSGLATIIVHPLKPYGFDGLYDRAMDALSDAELTDALAEAAHAGVAIEITTGFLPPENPSADSWSLDTPRRMLELARDAGCRFTLGSDSHRLEHLPTLDRLEPLVTSLGLTPDHFADITRAC